MCESSLVSRLVFGPGICVTMVGSGGSCRSNFDEEDESDDDEKEEEEKEEKEKKENDEEEEEEDGAKSRILMLEVLREAIRLNKELALSGRERDSEVK